MNCGCMNRRLSSEHERMRRLAKMTARMREETMVLYRNEDGTYGISPIGYEKSDIIEYITPY